jgi:UDP-2-acetamido-2,6-beta-L-arabino-hexul-4-ose reductase
MKQDIKTVLITGAKGFLGKNLVQFLNQTGKYTIFEYDVDNSDKLSSYLEKADFIFHLAGVNKPNNEDDYDDVNFGLTEYITDQLIKLHKKTSIVFSSSKQAELSNPYGKSKKKAEEVLLKYQNTANAPIYIFRFPNIFGKWSKPNYNSFIATLCYNISHDKESFIDDRNKVLEIIYIDEVIKMITNLLTNPPGTKGDDFCDPGKTFKITLGEIEAKLLQFKTSRETLILPDFSDELTRNLYATYLSYLEKDKFAYGLKGKNDQRGNLIELFKSKGFGQVFISTTKPGVTRGNHFHASKIEKFCVIKGDGLIKFRRIDDYEVLLYPVSGENIQIIDIPPGYTHSIENTSQEEMMVLFWANEVFDQKNPDTYFLEVEK